MRPKLAVYVVCCLLCTVCLGQRLSKVIPIPDTLSNLDSPLHLVYNARLSKLYVLGVNHDGGGAVVLDVATNRKIRQVKSCDDVGGACLDWHTDRIFCARSLSRRIYVVNCSTDAVVDSVVTPGEPYSIQYCWRQAKVYVTGFDSSMGVLDSRSGSLVRTVKFPGFPYGLYYCSDLNRIYATVYANESLSLVCAVDCITDSVVSVVGVHSGIGYETGNIAYDPPSRRLFCTNRRPWNDVTVIDCVADTLIGYVLVGDYPLSIVREPTTGTVWCSDWLSSDLSVIDPATLEVVDTLVLGGGPTVLYTSEQTGMLYCACPNIGMVYAVDPVSVSIVASARTGENPAFMIVPDLGGRLYVANVSDNTVSVRDASSLSEVAFIPVGRFDPYDVSVDTIRDIAFALSVGGGDALLTAIDCVGDSIIRNVAVPGTFGRVGCVAELDKVYCGTEQPDHVDVVQGSTGQLLKVLPGGPGTSWEPVYAVNAGKVYLVTNLGWLAVVDADADTLVSLRELFGQTSSVCYDPVGNKLYVAEDADGRVQVLDCRTDSVVKVLTNMGEPAALCYEPNGRKVYSADFEDSSVAVIDCRSDSVMKTLRVGPNPRALALSTASCKLYCANLGEYPNYDTSVSVVDINQDSVIRTIGVGMEPGYTMCYNPTTDRMFVGTGHWGGTSLAVIRCSDDRVVKRMQVPGKFWESAVLPSANKLYLPSEGGRSVSVIQDTASAGLEDRTATDAPFTVGATLIRRVLYLSEGTNTVPRASGGAQARSFGLLDIAGRNVMELRLGANDVRALAPGIYFVREAQSRAQAQAIRKVIVTR